MLLWLCFEDGAQIIISRDQTDQIFCTDCALSIIMCKLCCEDCFEEYAAKFMLWRACCEYYAVQWAMSSNCSSSNSFAVNIMLCSERCQAIARRAATVLCNNQLSIIQRKLPCQCRASRKHPWVLSGSNEQWTFWMGRVRPLGFFVEFFFYTNPWVLHKVPIMHVGRVSVLNTSTIATCQGSS